MKKVTTVVAREPEWMEKCRPICWTLNLSEVGQLTEDGKIFAFAGGPLTGPAGPKKVHKRLDGEVDGRSASVRTCGHCGGSGHNRRTCSNKALVRPVAAPKRSSSGRKCGKCGKSGHNARTCARRRR